ncbi:MAG TPA: biopolymer transporter ExbD [Planctomycetota bacterium]|nr:biopolymer transporter ExbD [Planctomycetota bacterium]
MRVRKKVRSAPGVPLASMSDIAMLLLIFFVLATQFLIQRALQAELPSVTSEKEKVQEKNITVFVEEQWVRLDEEQIAMEKLAPYLATKLADKTKAEERVVIVDGTPDVFYERVVWAINEIVRAGGIPTMMKVSED